MRCEGKTPNQFANRGPGARHMHLVLQCTRVDCDVLYCVLKYLIYCASQYSSQHVGYVSPLIYTRPYWNYPLVWFHISISNVNRVQQLISHTNIHQTCPLVSWICIGVISRVSYVAKWCMNTFWYWPANYTFNSTILPWTSIMEFEFKHANFLLQGTKSILNCDRLTI